MKRKKLSLFWVFKQLSSMEFKTEALIEGGGGGGGLNQFISSRSARRISFEINLNNNWFQKKFVGQNANI